MQKARRTSKIRFFGLDAHKETVAIAVVDSDASAPETVATINTSLSEGFKSPRGRRSERRRPCSAPATLPDFRLKFPIPAMLDGAGKRCRLPVR